MVKLSDPRAFCALHLYVPVCSLSTLFKWTVSVVSVIALKLAVPVRLKDQLIIGFGLPRRVLKYKECIIKFRHKVYYKTLSCLPVFNTKIQKNTTTKDTCHEYNFIGMKNKPLWEIGFRPSPESSFSSASPPLHRQHARTRQLRRARQTNISLRRRHQHLYVGRGEAGHHTVSPVTDENVICAYYGSTER